MKNNIRLLRAILAIIVISAMASGVGWWLQNKNGKFNSPPQLQLANADMIYPLQAAAPFTLTDDNGQVFNQLSLKGHWTMIFFGFTNCAMLCPTTLTTLSKVYANLQTNSQLHNLNVLFVSVDPERDSLARIKSYVTAFNPNFLGATGSDSQLTALTKHYGVMYAKIPFDQNDPSKGYYIDHSGFILLFNPEGKYTGIFSMPHDATKITQDYEAITQYYA